MIAFKLAVPRTKSSGGGNASKNLARRTGFVAFPPPDVAFLAPPAARVALKCSSAPGPSGRRRRRREIDKAQIRQLATCPPGSPSTRTSSSSAPPGPARTCLRSWRTATASARRSSSASARPSSGTPISATDHRRRDLRSHALHLPPHRAKGPLTPQGGRLPDLNAPQRRFAPIPTETTTASLRSDPSELFTMTEPRVHDGQIRTQEPSTGSRVR